MPFQIPAHALEPALPRNHPFCQNTIDVAGHGRPEEQELFEDIERFIADSGETVRIQRGSLRDADSYLVVTIGVGIATDLVAGFIKYLAKRLWDERESGKKPVIYISPAYAPKRAFRLPEEVEDAEEHFRRHPSRDSSENKEGG